MKYFVLRNGHKSSHLAQANAIVWSFIEANFYKFKDLSTKKKHILYNLHIMAWTELNYVLSEK